jgi:hypothetical protein
MVEAFGFGRASLPAARVSFVTVICGVKARAEAGYGCNPPGRAR